MKYDELRAVTQGQVHQDKEFNQLKYELDLYKNLDSNEASSGKQINTSIISDEETKENDTFIDEHKGINCKSVQKH